MLFRSRIREKAERDKQKADQERERTHNDAERNKIITALERISDQSKITEYHAHRAERYHRLVEKLTRRLEHRRFWLDFSGVLGIYIAAGVAVWAIIDAHEASDKQWGVMNDQRVALERLSTVNRAYLACERPSTDGPEIRGNEQAKRPFGNSAIGLAATIGA